ncbi:MAG TPA: GlsB/YeaQ/YmgE family stress response membrane protein [Thermoanaerobaculia bacterium]
MWLLSFIVIGALASWLAGQFMKGHSFGLVGDAIVGVIGAFIGAYVFRATGAEIGAGPAGSLIVGLAGAILLLFVVRLFTGRRSGRKLGAS